MTPFARFVAASRVARTLIVSIAFAATAGAQSASRVPAPAAPRIVVEYRKAADVFEILDQVSAWWPEYVDGAYRAAWIRDGRSQQGDSAFFVRYAQLRARYFDRDGQQTTSRREGSGLFTSGRAAGADPVGAAFYASTSVEDAILRLDRIVTPTDLAFLREFYAHFRTRTDLLTAETRSRTGPSRMATAGLLADPAVQRYVDRVAALFRDSASQTNAETPDSPLTALYVWWPDSTQTRATPSGRALLLRLRPMSGDTVNSADVVVHEAVHVFAAAMPPDRQLAMSALLLDGCAVPPRVRRLAVLEEPLATALGNIEFRRRFLPSRFSWSRRWYGDDWVEVYARLLHPMLAERVDREQPIDASFIRQATVLCADLVHTS